MDDNPYQAGLPAPLPGLQRRRRRRLTLRALASPITRMWALAACLAVFHAFMAAGVGMGGVTSPADGVAKAGLFAGITLVIAALYLGLGYGIHRRSRIAACLALVFCAGYLMVQLSMPGRPDRTLLAVIAVGTLVCLHGTWAIFAHHRHTRARSLL